MKQQWILLVTGLLSLASSAHSFPTGPPYDAFMVEKVTPPKEAPIDDYIIALSKATDINMIADATNFPVDSQVKKFPAHPLSINGRKTDRLGLIGDFCDQKLLTRFRFEEKTYLLWTEPELLDLGRLIVAQREREAALPGAQTAADEKQSYALLLKYFTEVRGWDGKTAGVEDHVKVADLPPDVRDLVEAAWRQRVFEKHARPGALHWFADDYWQKVRVVLGTSTEGEGNGHPVTALMLRGPMLEADYSMWGHTQQQTIGRVDALMGNTRRPQ